METIRYIDRTTGVLRQENVPGERWLQWLYHNPLGRATVQAVVKRQFLSRLYGLMMDCPGSKKRIPGFVECLGIDMDEAVRPVDDYADFNDFFVRELKPDARPVDNAPEAVVSPADGKVLAFEGVTGLDSFFVKSQEFSLAHLLRNRDLAQRYEDGTLLIVRLAPADYHRFHFPADGRVSASLPIRGDYYSVSPYAVKDRLSVYWENRREYSLLHTERAGDIVLCEVGATMVGSIVQTCEPDAEVRKGQEKGMFKFGGSTVIVLLEKGGAQVDADIVENTKKGFETSVRMGERIATALG